MISVTAGDTSYSLETESVKSLLEFPLNTLLAGVRAEFYPAEEELHDWRYMLRARINVANPLGLMQDHDWFKSGSSPDIKFSYTESDPTLTFVDSEAKASITVHDGAHLRLRLFGAYTFQLMHQNIDNYTGWQYQLNSSETAYDLYTISESGTPVLEYLVQYHRPCVGLMSSWTVVTHFSLDIGGRAEGVYMRDYDDHKLRNKRSEAVGIGIGARGTLRLRWTLKREEESRVMPYVTLGLRSSNLYVPAVGTQTWYGDDPATPNEEDEGTKITGLD